MKQHLHFRDAYIVDEKLIFSAVEMNGLFYREKNKNIAEFIAEFPGEDQLQSNLHSQIIEYDNKLYFIPLNGKGISFFDLNSKKIKTIPYEKNQVIEVIKAFLFDSDIFLLPLNAGTPFLIFHTKNNTYERLLCIEDEISKVIKRDEIWVDTFSAVMKDGVLYLALPGTDILVKCNLTECNTTIKKLGHGLRLNATAYFEGKVYMSVVDCSDTIEYDIDKEKIRRIKENKAIGKKIEERILISNKGKLYGISPGDIRISDKDEKNVKKISIPGQFCRKSNNYRLFAGGRSSGNSLWIFSASGGGTLWLKDYNINLLETFADSETENKIIYYQAKRLKREIEKNGYIVEYYCGEADLRNLEKLILYEKSNQDKNNVSRSQGGNIWDYLKKN